MSECLTVELTNAQRDVLLQGLRFVRSSLILDPRDPDSNLDSERDDRLRSVAALVDQLNGQPSKRTASGTASS